jgi:Tfp pilus assembly protein PilW
MTLVEMLVAILIAMIVSLAAFSLVDVTIRRTGTSTSRITATQQGRLGMDGITREVRSQVCVIDSSDATMTSARAIYAASPTSLTFFADLSDGSKAPELRQLSVVANAPAPNGVVTNKLVEKIYAGTLNAQANANGAATYSYAGYPASPTSTRVVMDNIAEGDYASGIYFQYFSYDTTSTPPQPTVALTGTLATTSLPMIAKISVSFRVMGSRGAKPTAPGTATFTDDVFVRSVDPNIPNPKPVCA